MKPLLVEVGTEEIPARMMSDALDRLHERWTQWITQRNIDPEFPDTQSELQVMGTPRRLVIRARLPGNQSPRVETIKGPPEEVAFEDGEPTQALKGFCRQHGVDPDQTEVREQDGGRYVFAEKQFSGRPTSECLQQDLEDLILNMQWPKQMRWESTGARFIRPIRWLLVLYDKAPLDCDLGPVTSRPRSRGLRFTEDAEGFEVNSFSQYRDRLGNAGIVLDPERRRERIRSRAEERASEEGGRPTFPGHLLSEVNFLVEAPTVFLGRFSGEFLELPDPVLKESMVSHQKYFPVEDPDSGELLPFFIGVRNGGEKGLDVVREGNERVIQARLNDADFFFKKDLETPYEDYRPELDGVVFQEQLGSLMDKTDRLGQMAKRLEGSPEHLARVARHCKNDLVTEMVGEFPDLQGIMGRIYAEESGWDPELAVAIEEHYQPSGRDAPVPESVLGSWLALIDRIDTLVGFFALGERPSGTADPYGLRRDALGLLRILIDRDIRWDLGEVIQTSVDTYGSGDLEWNERDRDELHEFLRDRLYFLFRRREDASDVLTEAVLSRFWSRPAEALDRLRWLQEWQGDPRFEDLVTSAQRIGNITRDVPRGRVDEDAFEEPEERQLWEAYQETRPPVEESLRESEPDRILQQLSSLRVPVDDYFDTVMVMCDDEDLRHNRQSMLREIRTLFDRIADFREL